MSIEAILDDLLAQAGWADAPRDRLDIVTRDKVLATPWPIAPMATAVLAALGLAASHLHAIRTGEKRRVYLDTRAAELAMCSSSYLQIEGKAAKFRDPFTGFYPARNGEYVYLHGNFAHLRDGLLGMLGVANDEKAIRSALAERDADAIEAEAIARGLCAARVRDKAQWDQTAIAPSIAATPVLAVRPRGNAGRRAFPPSDGTPLGGLNVLDFSRVIAGPMAGRSLAEHGAEVMLVSRPDLPFIGSLVVDTGFGKRSSYLDLRGSEDHAVLEHLLDRTDIFVNAYRPQSLARRGLGREALFARRPGIVSVDLSAFPAGNDWSLRRGYDSVVQATMGLTARDASGVPQLLPCQPLDYLTGYLAAFGAMVALIRSAESGHGWMVDLSLAATASWMWRWRAALGDDAAVPAANPSVEEIADLMQDHVTTFGMVSAMSPALRIGDADHRWWRGPVHLGFDEPKWSDGPR